MDQITQIFTTLQSNLLTLVIPVGVVGFILMGPRNAAHTHHP